jgi:hypothetical protein
MSNPLVVFAVLFSAVAVAGVTRQARMARVRRGEQYEDYLGSFEERELPGDVQRAVFEFLRNGLWVKFSVRASDSIERDYGIVGEDLDDAITAIASSCGRRIVLTKQRILTVQDLVILVAGFPSAGSS